MPYKDPARANAARRDRYSANIGHEHQRSRNYYQANRSQKAAYAHAAYLKWKARNPDGLWEQWLKGRHGLAPEQWFAMWEQQGGLCYLCEQELSEDRGKVHIDHDHSHCGKKRSCRYCRRGLTHDHCNLILGLLGEDIPAMRHVLATSFVVNFERTQAQTEALIATAPEQGKLFGDDDIAL